MFCIHPKAIWNGLYVVANRYLTKIALYLGVSRWPGIVICVLSPSTKPYTWRLDLGSYLHPDADPCCTWFGHHSYGDGYSANYR